MCRELRQTFSRRSPRASSTWSKKEQRSARRWNSRRQESGNDITFCFLIWIWFWIWRFIAAPSWWFGAGFGGAAEASTVGGDGGVEACACPGRVVAWKPAKEWRDGLTTPGNTKRNGAGSVVLAVQSILVTACVPSPSFYLSSLLVAESTLSSTFTFRHTPLFAFAILPRKDPKRLDNDTCRPPASSPTGFYISQPGFQIEVGWNWTFTPLPFG